MPRSQEKRFARSKSCGRQPERELRSASVHASSQLLIQRKGRSPARASQHPVEDINKEPLERPSHPPERESVSSIILTAPTDEQKSSPIVKELLPISSCAQLHDSSILDKERGPLVRVSDNRGFEDTTPDSIPASTSPPTVDLVDQIQRKKEDPDGALLLVLAELKEIKSQMIELRKTESVTASLVEQLAANTSRVNDLESKIIKDGTRVQNLGDNF